MKQPKKLKREHKIEISQLRPDINLDKYKSKVNKFILQINNCRFEQIGANSYGILFKIPANTLPIAAATGIYYVLNENMELITTGKYTCIV